MSMHLDFHDFEEKFKVKDPISDLSNSSLKQLDLSSLLAPERLRNVAILLKNLNVDIVVIEKALNEFDLDLLTMHQVEILQKIAPKEKESQLYKNYLADKRDISVLGPEDKFLLQLSKIENLAEKLNILEFMGDFEERYNDLNLNIYSLSSASVSLRTSNKFKTILELILSYGNYMNSSKLSGPAYGFKIQILNSLVNVKSMDKKLSLLEYIVTNVIPVKFPELLDLESELICIEFSSKIELKLLQSETDDLQANMKVLIAKENSESIKKFLSTWQETFNKLLLEWKNAEQHYKECAEYFGETMQDMDSAEFFTIIWNFIRNFKIFVAHVKKNNSNPTVSILVQRDNDIH